MEHNMGPRFETPIWDPDLGPPIWTPAPLGTPTLASTMDTHYEPELWTPTLDPDLGPLIWIMNPQYRPPICHGTQYGTLIWDPNLGPRFGDP
jgi:hypothetical protein